MNKIFFCTILNHMTPEERYMARERIDAGQVKQGAPPQYHTIVVGSGPIGLLSALSALKHCKPPEKVALLADRYEELGVRQQVLIINRDVFDFMQNLVGEELMNKYIAEAAITEDPHSPNPAKKNHFITTGDMERLFHDALKKNYVQGEHFDLIETAKIPVPRKDESIDYSKKIQVNTKQSVISVGAKKINGVTYECDDTVKELNCSLGFQNLVCADGAKRSVAQSLGDSVVSFVSNQKKLHHPKHVVATFKLPANSSVYEFLDKIEHTYEEEKVGPEKLTPIPLKELKAKFQWSSNARPYSQIYAVKDILYIGAELPDGLPKAKAREYARALLQDSLPEAYTRDVTDPNIDTSTKFGEKQQLLSTSIFDIELGELDRLVIPCSQASSQPGQEQKQTGAVFMMGDAAKQPLYTTGTGVQTGIREVMCFNKFLQESLQMGAVERCMGNYQKSLHTLLTPMRKRQDDWVEKINARVARAELNCTTFNQICSNFNKIDKLINKINQGRGGDEPTAIPKWVDMAQDKIRAIKENHTDLFKCICDKETVVDYNFLNMNDFIADLKTLKHALKQVEPGELPEELGELTSAIDEITANKFMHYREILRSIRDDSDTPKPPTPAF